MLDPTYLTSILWLVLFLVLLIVEGATVGLICIWFALGALAGMITSFITESLIIQLVVFILVSLLCMMLIRPFARKVFRTKKSATNADRILGETAVVTEEIRNLDAQGQVKVLGQYWTARSESGEIIPAETLVKVLRIEGVKVLVEPIQPL